ncbi:MAG: hypothetical protein WBP81_23945 [Solirubrobacteraceae bacterium]
MRISELRSEVRAQLLEFAWDQWAQLGVFATARREDRWAADPEALLLFTFEVARADARLFEEVLDWLVVNERLVSVQRLRNLCRDGTDRALVDASLAWAAQWRPRPRLVSREGGGEASAAEPLFRDSRLRVAHPDEAFRSHGWLKPRTEPSHKSRPPDLLAPINFAFRLRQILGVGARAEAVRVLLTIDASRVTALDVAELAGYAKRNVQEALSALHSSGVIDAVTVGNEQRFGIARDRWAALLGVVMDDLPTHQAWPQLLHALRVLVRWLEDDRHDNLSDYMLASEARTVADGIMPELRYAGVRLDGRGRSGAQYWQDFVELVRAAVGALA